MMKLFIEKALNGLILSEKSKKMHFLAKSVDFTETKTRCHVLCIFHLFLSASLKNLVNRTEPNFLGIKMYPNKVICEILEEFCGVTAPGKIIEVLK